MGRSGNQPGYKIFSISTTIRNPIRNTEFLEIIEEYDNKVLTEEIKDNIYYSLIQNGIYKFNKLDNYIKEKYDSGIKLTDEEIKKAIINNPQKTGVEGRIMTQIRALKDTGLISLSGTRNNKLMKITPLGRALLNNENVENVYSKAMIGLHAKNPMRDAIYNQSRPFLNLLFAINEINKKSNNNKGILWHEFAFFILSMKDCNYMQAVNEILKYRSKFKNKRNKAYLEDYIYNKLNLIHVEYGSILKDYADDVYRKFKMTGLITANGFGENVYIRFNEYNMSKVNAIIKSYSNYKYETFDSIDQYVNYISTVSLPWEQNAIVKEEVIAEKKQMLNIATNLEGSLDQQMEYLDSLHNKKIFDDSVKKYNFNTLKNELIILSRNRGKSIFEEVPEPVRLERLTALATAKVYGSQYVKPNLSLNDEGIPVSFAAGGKADIEFSSDDLYCLIEVTMMKDYHQQENSETTSISDHLYQLKTDKEKMSVLLAPLIHKRVVDYFQFCAFQNKVNIYATTIESYVNILETNNTVNNFKNAFLDLGQQMQKNTSTDYC